MKDGGVDPMLPALETPPAWPVEFEKQQRMILELWQTCNVSLVHRTYFYLLFKGDPADSIYMGVELRRLSFLKESFSHGNQTVEGGRTLTLASRFSLSLPLSHSHTHTHALFPECFMWTKLTCFFGETA